MKVIILGKQNDWHISILIGALISYVCFYYIPIYVFPDSYYITDLDIRLSSIFIEVIGLISLCYSILYKKKTFRPFWILILIGVLCFSIGDILGTYHPFELPMDEFDISDLFVMLFSIFFLSAFFYKLMKECDKWGKAFLICDICIIVTAVFTLEWYLFNQPSIRIYDLSVADAVMKFFFPITDVCFLLLGISFFFYPTIFKSNKKLYLFITVLIGYALIDYTYTFFADNLPSYIIVSLRALYRVLLLCIAIAAAIRDTTSRTSYFIMNPVLGKQLLIIFPYLAITILIGFTLKENTASPTLIIGNCITFIFSLIRHVLARMQNRELTKALQSFNKQLEDTVKQRTSDLMLQTEIANRKQQKFQSLHEYHPDPIFTIDLNGVVSNVNKAGSTMLKVPVSELLGKSWFSIVIDRDKPKFAAAIQNAKEKVSTSFEILANYNRQAYSFNLTIVPIILNEQVTGIYILVKDITEMKRQQEQIHYLAFHDSLTTLGNRAFFQRKLEDYIKQSEINDRKFALLFIDINRFNLINDTLGHKAGDIVLREVATRLQPCIPQDTPLARIGGDEFTILIRNATDKESLLDLCNELIHTVKKPMQVHNHTYHLSLSIGIAIYPEAGTDTTLLFQHADIAMHDAKLKTEHAISFYDESLSKQMGRRLRLEKDLPKAIENEEFFLLYQPQVDSSSYEVIGAEALIRWNHPELGIVSPYEFIPIAEESMHILEIGKWALQKACTQMKEWQTLGYSHLKIGVNVSAKGFQQDLFVPSVLSILKETGLAPHCLDLELTERIAMVDEKETLQKLRKLKEIGVHISIDDFGTGYSSLAYLPLYPIDMLKIPREFILMADESKEGKEIITTIISLSHTLHMSVIAEGVETKQQLQFLQQNGCHYVQGYYFSKPLAPEDFLLFLQTHVRCNK
ncbi:sensor domain-containing protein [Bacillus cytotoxicus]|uniref:sensor domain-containing protein n=1 Tax=Bacillus cereus group TaxID=86661 RepID=UPI001AEEB0E8|nr:EAL domain-containing protein [Bacillus cytotoxicus]HDR4571357.1 EAL domain-containing protein [Bacillus cytotoxicus]HDR4587168.1 EAL domain-containing protein [Bacillus cytotoxicus]